MVEKIKKNHSLKPLKFKILEFYIKLPQELEDVIDSEAKKENITPEKYLKSILLNFLYSRKDDLNF